MRLSDVLAVVGLVALLVFLLGLPSGAPDVEGRATADLALKSSVVIVEVSKGQHLAGCGGTLIDPQHVLTAFHCVRGRDKGHNVLTWANYEKKEVVKADVERFWNGWDVAVLRLERPVVGRPAPFAPDVYVGETVYAVGAPDGNEFMVTKGIVGKVEEGAFSNCRESDKLGTEDHQLLLTDSSIWSGNSGGGLFNVGAQLLGVAVRMAIISEGTCDKPAVGGTVLWGYYVGPDQLRKALR